MGWKALVVPLSLLTIAAWSSSAAAQCVGPGPFPEQYAANQVKLKYLGTGPGFGDDRPEIKKSAFFAPTLGFNPQTTHTVRITLAKDVLGGLPMWSTVVPPSAVLWSQVVLGNGNVRWTFNDPAVTFGIRKAQIIQYVGGSYVWKYIYGRNQNITNAPLIPLVNQVNAVIELENGGVGYCYEGTANRCTGAGNTQTCKVAP